MASQTLALAREALAALSAADLPRMVELSDPEVEWHSFFAALGEGGVYRGHEGTAQYLRDLSEAWEIVRADVDDGVAVGDVAVVVGRIHYRGKGSGIETETDAGWMLRFRDGLLIRFRAFREPEEALADVGLRPVGGTAPSPSLELARAISAHWSRGDFASADWAHPDIEFVQADLPGAAVRTGLPAMADAWREFLSAWDEFRVEPEEYLELDDERVAVLGTFAGRGKHSGMDVGPVRMRGVVLFHIRDRRVTRLVTYYNRERGLAELGLPTAPRGRA
jgi:hypothetical protein